MCLCGEYLRDGAHSEEVSPQSVVALDLVGRFEAGAPDPEVGALVAPEGGVRGDQGPGEVDELPVVAQLAVEFLEAGVQVGVQGVSSEVVDVVGHQDYVPGLGAFHCGA